MAALVAHKNGDSPSILQDGERLVWIDSVIEDPRNERKTFENVEGLAVTIKEFGLIEAIAVTPIEGDKYMVTAGHRRYRACKLAGLEKIRITVKSGDSETDRRLKSVISNVQREDVAPFEMAQGLASIIEEEGLEQQQLAEKIGKTKDWVSGMLRILSLPAELIDRVGRAQLSSDSLIRIARLDNAEAQSTLIDDLIAGASRAEIREKIREVKGQDPLPSNNGQPVVTGEVPDKKQRMKFVTKKTNTAVIIQSLDLDDMTIARQISALQEALRQARARMKMAEAVTDEIVSAAE